MESFLTFADETVENAIGKIEEALIKTEVDIPSDLVKYELPSDKFKYEICVDMEEVEIKPDNKFSGKIEDQQIKNEIGDIKFASIKQETSSDIVKNETCTEFQDMAIKVENNTSDDSKQDLIKLENMGCIKSEDSANDLEWANFCHRPGEDEYLTKLGETDSKSFVLSEESINDLKFKDPYRKREEIKNFDNTNPVNEDSSLLKENHRTQVLSNTCEETNECRSTNIESTPYKCDICNKYYKTAATRNNHNRIHTGHKLHICEFCGKQFLFAQGLKQHIGIHTGKKPYKCNICNKEFSYLWGHMRTHTGEKPYTCSICKKSFSQRSNLKLHLRSHLGEKALKCEECNEHFSVESSLVAHHERVHDKPHQCKICNKSFTVETALARHMGTHVKKVRVNKKKKLECEKLMCDICGLSCRFASNLTRHKQSHNEHKRLEIIHLQKKM